MITVLSGKNAYRRKAELDKRVAKAEEAVGAMGVERLDAFESGADVVIQAVQSLPFLAPRKLVVVQNAQANTQLMERIDEVFDRTDDSVDVVLIGPVFDKRKAQWKTLKKRADEVVECADLKPFELPQWVADAARDLGSTISKAEVNYLIERVGTNQAMLHSELTKLAIAADDGSITRELIQSLTDQTVQSTIFQMLDSSFAGQPQRAIELYREQRTNRVDPHYVVAMLAWQLQGLALAVYASPQTEQTLVSAGQSPFTAKKSLQLARRTSRSRLKHLTADLIELDKGIKKSADADSSL